MVKSASVLAAAAAVGVCLLAHPASGFLAPSIAKASLASSARAAGVRVWSSSPDTITSPFESGVKVGGMGSALGFVCFDGVDACVRTAPSPTPACLLVPAPRPPFRID